MFDLNSQWLTSRKFQNNLELDFVADVDVGAKKHFTVLWVGVVVEPACLQGIEKDFQGGAMVLTM